MIRILKTHQIYKPFWLPHDIMMGVISYANSRVKFWLVHCIESSSHLKVWSVCSKFPVFWNTVEPPLSDHPKCKDLVAAYGRWSLTRIEPQRFSSDKKSGRVYFNEENLLHAISKLRHVQLHVVTKALRIFEVG